MSSPFQSEKDGIVPSTSCNPSLPHHTKKVRLNYKKICFIGLGVYCALSVLYAKRDWFESFYGYTGYSSSPACPQVDTITPEKHNELWKAMNNKISTPEFQESAINWLGGAVRVPTESFDNMDPVGVDPRWNAFGPFHDYLLSAFPLVHSKLKLNKVNTYGLYYEWTGSDASLKPLLLAAHQDVVPVDPTTVDQWTHPPYSGYFDGKRIWGRGSSDDKSGLIGILTSIETLLAANFEPTRTVVLAFGFDEEASGFQGAGKLGPFLQETYGEDGFAMVVDEGSGFVEQYGTVVATPGIAEKGFLNTLVEVTAPGGHSSIPPAHTSIGILSSLLVHFERNPYKVEITRHEPMYDTLQCVAEHGKSIPAKLRKVIKKSAHSKSALRALQEFIREDKVLSSLVGTTQAIDLIHGGVKSNALPEQAWAIVNHRIAVVSSVDAVKAHDTALLESLSKKFNLTYSAFGKKISQDGASASGTLTLSDAFNGALEPAPITPTDKDAAPYHLLSGTIKATFNAHRGVDMGDSKSIIVAPSMMSGNTDTRFYWKLSKHIFRYNHHSAGNDSKNPLSSVHTVNEFAEVDSFLEMIRFFTTLILNADESTSL